LEKAHYLRGLFSRKFEADSPSAQQSHA
jgi:hypothetical protein